MLSQPATHCCIAAERHTASVVRRCDAANVRTRALFRTLPYQSRLHQSAARPFGSYFIATRAVNQRPLLLFHLLICWRSARASRFFLISLHVLCTSRISWLGKNNRQLSYSLKEVVIASTALKFHDSNECGAGGAPVVPCAWSITSAKRGQLKRNKMTHKPMPCWFNTYFTAIG